MDIHKVVVLSKVENVITKIIDKGFAGDVNINISILGRELVSVEARIVGASIEKFVQYANNFKTIVKDISENGRVFLVDAKYNLIKDGLKLLPGKRNSNITNTTVNSEMIKEIVSQVVSAFSENKKTIESQETQGAHDDINIKTNYFVSITDKSKELDSNIGAIDVQQEEQVDNTTDNAVNALKKAQRRSSK
jgi:hypothetical protein